MSASVLQKWLASTFRQAAWAPLTVFVFYAVAAKGFNAYIDYPRLDIPTHFFGGVAITYFYLVAIAHGQHLVGRLHRSIQLLLALGLTAIAAVIWEFLEFLSDAGFGTLMNLGVADTLVDLFFGLLGGLVMISVAACTPGIARVASK